MIIRLSAIWKLKNEKVKFQRIDADVTDSMKEEVSEEELKGETRCTDSPVQKSIEQ